MEWYAYAQIHCGNDVQDGVCVRERERGNENMNELQLQCQMEWKMYEKIIENIVITIITGGVGCFFVFLAFCHHKKRTKNTLTWNRMIFAMICNVYNCRYVAFKKKALITHQRLKMVINIVRYNFLLCFDRYRSNRNECESFFLIFNVFFRCYRCFAALSPITIKRKRFKNVNLKISGLCRFFVFAFAQHLDFLSLATSDNDHGGNLITRAQRQTHLPFTLLRARIWSAINKQVKREEREKKRESMCAYIYTLRRRQWHKTIHWTKTKRTNENPIRWFPMTSQCNGTKKNRYTRKNTVTISFKPE